MPTSPETVARIDSRRIALLELLTLALSYDEIADVMSVARHVVGNDITALKQSKRMPDERPTLDYYTKLVLYRDALANQIDQTHGFRFNADTALCTRIATVLRESLDIKDVVKSVNLMLKGIGMQRMHKLPRELWRTAAIWRIALSGYEANNGVVHDFYRSRLLPAPFVATFTVNTFEEWLGRWLNHAVVTPMGTVDELAERFVAFIEFRAFPGNNIALVPNQSRGWDESFLRVDLAITETARELIEKIIGENCTHNVVVMLDMLVPRSGDPGMTLEEIGQEFCLTRERIRQILTKTFRVIKDELRKALGDAPEHGVNVTDTAQLLRINEVRGLCDELNIANARLAEYKETLTTAGLLTRETVEVDSVGAFGEKAFAAMCLRVDELDLSVRSANGLWNADIKYIWQIVEKTEGEMLKVKNFGRKSLNEVREHLEEHELKYGMKIPPAIRARLPKA